MLFRKYVPAFLLVCVSACCGTLYSEEVPLRQIDIHNAEGGVSVLRHLLVNWESIERALLAYAGSNIGPYYLEIQDCVSKEISLESLAAVHEHREPSKTALLQAYDVVNPVDTLYSLSIETGKPCIVNGESLREFSWLVAEHGKSFRVLSYIYIEE